jgi:hypothetical protein
MYTKEPEFHDRLVEETPEIIMSKLKAQTREGFARYVEDFAS